MQVTVADDLFGGKVWSDGAWATDPAFLVVTDQAQAGAAALAAASVRLMHVDTEGVEVAHWQTLSEDHLTPSDISGVVLTDRGPALWMDTGGALGRRQADVMVAVIREELERRGVSGHITAPGADDFDGRFPAWFDPTLDVSPEPDAPTAWFVRRGVAARTTTGERYLDVEWLTSGRTWSWDRNDAEQFDDVPTDLIAELSGEPRAPDRQSVFAVRLPLEVTEDPDMPPVEIRQRPL